jgi:preprotein translocase subunit SecD
MKAMARRFNLFLALLTLAALCGCQTAKTPAKQKKDKQVSALRIHAEFSGDAGGTSLTIAAPPRADPVVLTIIREPFLTEANIIAAGVIKSPGGLGSAVAVQFDESGALILEQYSSASVGKHFAIFGQWGDKASTGRWLAAPLITHRIANGVLSFNGDFNSTNELDRLVLGLNNVAKKNKKGKSKE